MSFELISNAIESRRELEFNYQGLQRVVQPAAVGTHKSTGKLLLRAYQIEGSSSSNDGPHWALFSLDEMTGVELGLTTFAENPPGYRSGDRDLDVLIEL